MEYILGLFGLLLGALGYNWVKRRGAEALLQNNEVKSKLNDLGVGEAKNQGLLLSEEDKRASLNTNADVRKNEPVKPSDF